VDFSIQNGEIRAVVAPTGRGSRPSEKCSRGNETYTGNISFDGSPAKSAIAHGEALGIELVYQEWIPLSSLPFGGRKHHVNSLVSG